MLMTMIYQWHNMINWKSFTYSNNISISFFNLFSFISCFILLKLLLYSYVSLKKKYYLFIENTREFNLNLIKIKNKFKYNL